MPFSWKIVLGAVLISAGWTGHAAWAKISERQQLARLEAKSFQAGLSADLDGFASIADVEYRTVNEDGSAGDLRDVLTEMRSATPLHIEGTLPPPSEHLTRIIGNIALISGRVPVVTSGAARDIRYLEVWVRRPSGWKFVHWQATRIQPEGLDREKRFKAEANRHT